MPVLSSFPIAPVLAHLATAAGSDVPSSDGLVAALARVPVPRERRGVRHGITTVLSVTVCAVLVGCRSFTAIGEWAANASEEVLAALEVRCPPSESTIRRTLQRLDRDALDTTLGGWAAARTTPPAGARRAVAIDGKTVRGSDGDGVESRHLLGAIDHDAGVVIGQVDVAAKTNEIPMLSQLIDQIGTVRETVFTVDARHAQRSHADYLTARGAHFVFTVKRNQPSLHDQLKALPWTAVPVAHTTTGREHGQEERRILNIVTVAAGIVFGHAHQAIHITRKMW